MAVYNGNGVIARNLQGIITQAVDSQTRDSLVNKVEHLVAKDTDISLRRWWRPKPELKEREYWTQTG